ncbi:hypothetical protein GGR58DRAFT_476156 [Xylaria digitata]|nr:hypothetical protein GGR58DRAFT_476156 [Xylaria digitata]
MKTSVVLAAVSASLVVGELSPPQNFPACGTTCFSNMLSQASQLGCGGGGSTADTVDGACLCKNLDFSYGIIDCANEACPDGVAPTVVQYGVDWCGEKGIVISGLSATPDSSIVSSPIATVTAVATASGGSTGSGSASATTATNSDGSSATSAVDTATLTNSSGEASGTGVVIPISTTDIVSTVTNSDGVVETTTVPSTIFSTSTVASGSGTESGSATESGSSTILVTESTITASDSTLATSATVTAPISSTEGSATSTESDGGAFQTAAPVGLMAAAGLAALML